MSRGVFVGRTRDMGVMMALCGVILLALAPDYFRFRLSERGLTLVVLGVLAIVVGARMLQDEELTASRRDARD